MKFRQLGFNVILGGRSGFMSNGLGGRVWSFRFGLQDTQLKGLCRMQLAGECP